MKKTICLTEFKINQEGTILKVNGEGLLRRRLFDMGVTNGAEVVLKKKANYKILRVILILLIIIKK